MAKVKSPPTEQAIRDANPEINAAVLTVYFDALALYREASEEIDSTGAVIDNPKTGAPMKNPYLSIRDLCANRISRFHKEYPEFDSGE